MTGPGAAAPGKSAVLDVDQVWASYGSYRALFGVSFSVGEGAIVALLGSNGAGKSTVARVVSGLVQASSGTVTFAERDITRLPAYKIARLGMVHVPEGRGIFSSLTVEENLLLSFRQRVPKRSVGTALERAYSSFPVLSERRTQTAGTLSGGQQRILALARVLATPPRLLIVDELSLGLAPAIIDSVYEALVAIRKTGCAVLVVEQQVVRALAIADSAVLLARGRVAWTGPPSDAAQAMERVLGGRLLAAAAAESEDDSHQLSSDDPGGDEMVKETLQGGATQIVESHNIESHNIESHNIESHNIESHNIESHNIESRHGENSQLGIQATSGAQTTATARKEGT